MIDRIFRRNKRPLPGRGPVRWTRLELALVVVSVLLIVFPLYAEAYRWINPVSVPAAPLAARATERPTASNNDEQVTAAPAAPAAVPQATRATATSAPGTAVAATAEPTTGGTTSTPTTGGTTSTPTTGGATSTPTTGGATSTPTTGGTTSTPTTGGATSTPSVTLTPGGATNTPTETVTPGGPTDAPTETVTPGGPTDTPTETRTAGPATETPTPLAGEPDLSVELVASTSSAKRLQEFSYVVSIFSGSATARTVSLSDNIDDNLTVTGITSSSGNCPVIAPVACTDISVQNGSPASVTIRVRVKDTAPAGRLSNRATVTDSGTSASSRSVSVEITADAAPTSATSAPTSTTPGPTSETPNPTVQTPNPTNTSQPSQPTNTPRPSDPTNTPKSGGGGGGGGNDGGGGGGGNKDRDKDRDKTEVPASEPPPEVPPLAALPPTAKPGGAAVPPPAAQPARPAARPTQAARPARVTPRPALTAAPATAATAATAVPPTSTPVSLTPPPVALESGLYFRMASNWGSAFAGDPVYYVIAIRNNRPASGAPLNNIQVTSTLPPNLEITDKPKADKGDVVYQQGSNVLMLKVAALKPGESVEIGVQTKIKANALAGAKIVAQAAVTYDGLSQPAYSNIVTVQVVSGAPLVQPTQGATAAPTNSLSTQNASGAGASGTPTLTPAVPPTSAAYPAPATQVPAATSAPAATNAAAATSVPTTGPAPTAVSAPTAAPAPTIGPASGGSASLPDTSSGVPIMGVVLLGMTLMIRTVRVHREQNRI